MRVVGLLFVIFFIQACTPEARPDISFYYWKTVFKLSPFEKQNLLDNNVTKLYVRYFDVILKGDVPVPESAISFDDVPENIQVIPVVYIKNEVMLGERNLEDLGTKIIRLIDQINNTYHLQCDEIQLDCDWTLNSKDNFFRFVQLLKKSTERKLSATIRLHQIKYYQKTGVPEVDKGVLMYYNMGRISSDTTNSIYDQRTASRYTESLKHYPLALDVALPVFSWGVHLRNNRVIGLLGKLNSALLESDCRFIHGDIPVFEAKENVIMNGYYFMKGDRIKIESVSDESLREIAGELTNHLAEKPKQIIFFDLDSANVNQYANGKNFFKEISGRF